MPPLVSILIPCYNAEKWVASALESAIAQTWSNTEIIVINDGSTDSSLQVARTFESQTVKIITQLNQGASAARNRAFLECQGDFIQYLDADDLLSPDKIERQIKLLCLEENIGHVAAGEWARFRNSQTEANFLPETVWKDMAPIDWLICSWEGGGMMHPAAWLVPRVVADKAGLWNESLSLDDDGEYFCRVLLASEGVKFCKRAKSYYRSGITASLSGIRTRHALESSLSAIELWTSHLLAQENSFRTQHACATSFQRFIYAIYPTFPDLVRQAEANVQALGGSNLKPDGGRLFQILTNTLGWRSAKHLQNQFYRLKSKSLTSESN
jgi:glycosyltransferase involved in cell wall biosynthesis